MGRLSPHEARKRLQRILGDSVNCAVGLKEILEDERTALENQDSKALEIAAATKEICIQKLQRLESERLGVCADSGFDPRSEGILALAKWCDGETYITERWNQLLDIGRNCNNLNLTNGAIISVRRQQIENNLSILMGGSSELDTYGPQGTDSAVRGKRRLADA